MGMELSKEYERVVLFDADSLVVSTMPEVIEGSYTVAGVRAFSDHGALQNFHADHYGIKTYEDFSYKKDRQNYLNLGLVVACGQGFWKDWHELNLRCVSSVMNIDEGTFNMLVYDKYLNRLAVIDPPSAPYYYGTCSAWGENGAWESWGSIEIEGEALYLNNIYGVKKQVKVLHEAGHGDPRTSVDERMNLDSLFQKSVADFLRKISTWNA
jgi:hypothetical protein